MAVIITDQILDPYYMVCEKGQIKVFKKAIRKKKDGETENIKKLIATPTNMTYALKEIIDDCMKYKSKDIVAVANYVTSYKQKVKELKEFLKIDKDVYI